jgi:glycerophosphoryl diester phosphodiesterase
MDAIHPKYTCLRYDAELTKKAQKRGLQVNPWTVNEIADIEYCVEQGVNAIISDFPDRVSKILKARGI